jgi:hypothetical protein
MRWLTARLLCVPVHTCWSVNTFSCRSLFSQMDSFAPRCITQMVELGEETCGEHQQHSISAGRRASPARQQACVVLDNSRAVCFVLPQSCGSTKCNTHSSRIHRQACVCAGRSVHLQIIMLCMIMQSGTGHYGAGADERPAMAAESAT